MSSLEASDYKHVGKRWGHPEKKEDIYGFYKIDRSLFGCVGCV